MKIGPHKIGSGRTFITAEIGINHNGSVDLARQLISAAAWAGADAVKFQTFRADELGCSPEIAACELPPEAWPVLARFAADQGLVFFSTPFDCESVDLLDPLVPCFKIASGEITNEKLLRRVASKGKPVILSTGMATEDEIEDAYWALNEPVPIDTILLHCVSAYPAPASEMNLSYIHELRQTFGLPPVGLSDHSLGVTIPIAAVALGACVIEKHLTLSRKMKGPDHHMSADSVTFRLMVEAIRTVEAALGDGVKRCQPSEEATKKITRRAAATGKRP